MENEPDLSGVDPARWPEIRRRVAILDEFTSLVRPGAKERRRYAGRLGVSESQFLHLARVWRIKRDPASLPGARSRIAVKRAARLPDESMTVARHVIDELGPLARRRDVLAAVAERSGRTGVAAPSATTVTKMLAEARAAATTADGEMPELLIDKCSIRLPVADGKDVVMPRAVVAIVMPQRRIVACDVGCSSADRPSIERLMTKVAAMTTGDGQPLRLRAPHAETAERLAIGAIGADEGRNLPTLSQILGSRIGDLEVVFQEGKARHAKTLTGARHASPLTPEDAMRAIGEAIEAHNSGKPQLPPEGFSLALAATSARPGTPLHA